MLNKVKIGWKEYAVKYLEPQETLIANADECYGIILYEKKEIHINKEYDDERKKETLIHEVLHGIEDMYHIELGEETVTRLSQAIYTVLKDNHLVITHAE